MRPLWNDAIQMYAAEVAGAALRHDFGVPFGIIGRNAGFILELSEEGKLNDVPRRDRETINGICVEIGQLSAEIHNSMRRLGRLIKEPPANDPKFYSYTIAKSYREVNITVGPLLNELHSSAVNLERLTARISDRDILKYIIDLAANARRAQAMYSGLHFFFKLDNIDEYLFTPVDFHKLCSSTAKVVRMAAGFNNNLLVSGHGEVECIENQMNSVIQNLGRPARSR